MKSNPKVAVYTSTRAEYGLLRPLMKKMVESNQFEVRIFATGTHLSVNYGHTIKEIETDFPYHIYYKVEHFLNQDEKNKNNLLMADAIVQYTKALSEDRPDAAIVLGDRFEAFAFGIVCANLAIPILHLHGGELTYGAIDDKYRHCLTKLSEWHFVAAEEYRKRVLQLGEKPDNVFNVGALGVDNALNLPMLTKQELASSLKFDLSKDLFVFTFHPETNSEDYGLALLKAFLDKLTDYLKESDCLVIATGVNNDPGSGEIKQLIDSFIIKNPDKVHFFESLGVQRYLSLVRCSNAVLGNSSSGILEAYSLKVPTVNIGARQDGRVRESSVLDFPNANSLSNLNFAELKSIKMKLLNEVSASKFGQGDASSKMIEVLKKISPLFYQINKTPKTFNDLN